MTDALIIGAGVSGLALGRRLLEKGREPLVLEKSRGVGGRVATRRVDGQPVDHGVAFLHGSHPEFLEALDAVEGTALEGWPRRVEGGGRPCQPDAFRVRQRRLAFAEGVNAFPKRLARGLDVRNEVRVVELVARGAGIEAKTEDGDGVTSPTVVLTLPLEQTLGLLRPLAESDDALRPAVRLLEMIATEPCLALLAGYESVPGPEWDILYPSIGDALLLVSHDSAKRPAPRETVLVYQCTRGFSKAFLEEEPTSWAPRVLSEASELVGPWAGRPAWTQPHRWRYSRLGPAPALTDPLLVTLPGGARVGIAGEAFSKESGVEAAFLSGRRLADKLYNSSGGR